MESTIIHPSDQDFLDLPRVYRDIPSSTLMQILEELTLITEAFSRFESKVESALSEDYSKGMKVLDLCLHVHHQKLIAKASIQVLAELTLRVYLNGDDGRYFINSYALENTAIFSRFYTQSVIELANVWENQLNS